MSMVRLSITDCVTPMRRRPKTSCRRKCMASVAVAVIISRRATVAVRLSLRLPRWRSSFCVSNVISTTAVNCIIPSVIACTFISGTKARISEQKSKFI